MMKRKLLMKSAHTTVFQEKEFFKLKTVPFLNWKNCVKIHKNVVEYVHGAQKILLGKTEESRSAEDCLLLGNILQDKDRIDEALYMFKKSIEVDPKYYKAHYNLGYIYLSQDKPNMALAEFKQAVKYKDNFAYGYYNMGCAYLALKQYRNARYNFYKALDIKGDEPSIYYNLAYTYKMLNNEKQAKTYYDLYNKLIERQ